MQVAGSLPEGADQTTLFEDPITGAQVIGHHEEGRLVGVVGWNAPAQMLPYRRDLAAGMAHATARRAA